MELNCASHHPRYHINIVIDEDNNNNTKLLIPLGCVKSLQNATPYGFLSGNWENERTSVLTE
ncbi:hypothetical protein CR513_49120, partial [Mucuna pruriens]